MGYACCQPHDTLSQTALGMAMREARGFTRVISLGSACTTKFQIARTLPQYDDGTNIFDWQVTPCWATAAYIESDFDGIFEREDLEVENRHGSARNRKFDVLHSHAFCATGERLTEVDIDAQYPEARNKIDYLAAKFRKIFADCGPVLYVMCAIPPADEVAKLIRAIKRRASSQLFHLACVGMTGVNHDHDLSEFGGSVSRAFVNLPSKKSADRQWEGDDETWESVLLALTAPIEPFLRTQTANTAVTPLRR
jgi:hypothetical protein